MPDPGVLKRFAIKSTFGDEMDSLFNELRGASRVLTQSPANTLDLKFNSQRKLDFPLAILDFLVGPPIGRRFRERADLRCARLGGASTIENLGAEMLAAKVWMVDDVEEFGAELQHAGLSEKSQLGVLHQ